MSVQKACDLEDDDKSVNFDQILTNAEAIETKMEIVPFNRIRLGLCFSCTHLEFAESEFNIEHARCKKFKRDLMLKRPIIRCNGHEQKGVPTLYDMNGIAWILDFGKRDVGFRGDK